MERSGVILRAIFNSSDDVWFFVSSDYSILFFNQKAFDNGLKLHGRELKTGDCILDYARDTKNDIDPKFIDCFGRASKGEIVKTDEYIEYNSTSVWMRSKYIPVYEEENLIGISINIEDITLQKQNEEDRKKHQEEILALSNKREEFIDIASHELKTPLTSLKASLQIVSRNIEAGDSVEVVKRFIDKCNEGVNKLNALIGNLLDSNKIIKGALQLNKSTIVLSEMIRDCCYYVYVQGKYDISITGEESLTVVADKDRIEQVLINLINNAVKYASGSKEIAICVSRIENMAKVSVQDFGPGIPTEKLGQIFQRYYQGKAQTHRDSGMGLGLYIAEGIIKQHGGEMGVESEENKGSCFWFTLPLDVREG